jgi:hypothetical protein
MWLAKKLGVGAAVLGTDPAAGRRLQRRRTPLLPPPAGSSDAAAFTSGKFLSQFADGCAHLGVVKTGRPRFQKSMQAGSVCTGSAMDQLTFRAISAAFAKEEIDVSFEIRFICEIDKQKREFATAVHKISDNSGGAPCAFPDISTISEHGIGECALPEHKGCDCQLPSQLDGLVGGISCKDFSKCNQNRKEFAWGWDFQQNQHAWQKR